MLGRYWHRLRSILGTVMPNGPGADMLIPIVVNVRDACLLDR